VAKRYGDSRARRLRVEHDRNVTDLSPMAAFTGQQASSSSRSCFVSFWLRAKASTFSCSLSLRRVPGIGNTSGPCAQRHRCVRQRNQCRLHLDMLDTGWLNRDMHSAEAPLCAVLHMSLLSKA
jgi:hypothetical protein